MEVFGLTFHGKHQWYQVCTVVMSRIEPRSSQSPKYEGHFVLRINTNVYDYGSVSEGLLRGNRKGTENMETLWIWKYYQYIQLWKEENTRQTTYPSMIWHGSEKLIVVITEYRVTIATNCMDVLSYVVGHERVNSVLFQCIVSILRALIFLCEYVKCSMLCKGDLFVLVSRGRCRWTSASTPNSTPNWNEKEYMKGADKSLAL
jgi:hypothetical protein